MELVIDGQKYINSNTYDNLVISNKQSNENCVLVTASTKIDLDVPNAVNKNGFIKTIRDSEVREQVLGIVDYHLEKNRIYSVKYNHGLEAYSTSGKRIYNKAKLSDEELVEKINNKILLQYQLDRYAFINSHSEINDYEFWAAPEFEYRIKEEKICIKLFRDKTWNVIEREQLFILEFIHEKLHRINCEAKLYHYEKCLRLKTDLPHLPYFKIECGDLSIILYGVEGSFKVAITNLVNFYNFNREYQLSRKLNMEGIL